MGIFSFIFGNNVDKVKVQEKQKIQKILKDILDTSVKKKLGNNIEFKINEAENNFFSELIKQTIETKLSPYKFYFEPMGSKAFNVWYDSYYIGKIKLNNKSTYMQVLKGLHVIKNIEDLEPEEYLSYIPAWIRYIKYCLRN